MKVELIRASLIPALIQVDLCRKCMRWTQVFQSLCGFLQPLKATFNGYLFVVKVKRESEEERLIEVGSEGLRKWAILGVGWAPGDVGDGTITSSLSSIRWVLERESR